MEIGMNWRVDFQLQEQMMNTSIQKISVVDDFVVVCWVVHRSD